MKSIENPTNTDLEYDFDAGEQYFRSPAAKKQVKINDFHEF